MSEHDFKPQVEPTETASAANKSENSVKNMILDWAEVFLQALTIIVLIFMFIGRSSVVKGDSMVPTLHDKDLLLISDMFYTPARGDIVVVVKKSFQNDAIVKRIIALEGDTVDIDYVNNHVLVNDKIVEEDYIDLVMDQRGSMSFPATVPDGHIFVMGDNRNHSLDSRENKVGMIDRRCILGKVIFRLFPLKAIGTV